MHNFFQERREIIGFSIVIIETYFKETRHLINKWLVPLSETPPWKRCNRIMHMFVGVKIIITALDVCWKSTSFRTLSGLITYLSEIFWQYSCANRLPPKSRLHNRHLSQGAHFSKVPITFSGPESYFMYAMFALKTQILLVLKAKQ